MRRHESLQTLSREHHRVLQLARALQPGVAPRLRDTLPADPTALVAEVRRLWIEELEPHFRVEEDVLAPAIEGRSPELARLAMELRAQHTELRKVFARLDAPGMANDNVLDLFGRMLERHVRWEERSLFETIQQLVSIDALAGLRVPMSLAASASS